MANRYRTALRPAGSGGLPMGVTFRYVELPNDGSYYQGWPPTLLVSRHLYGVIETDRPLTSEEMAHFDIVAADSI